MHILIISSFASPSAATVETRLTVVKLSGSLAARLWEVAMADDIVRPRRLYKQVAEKIEAMVADGSLAVGAQIPSEVELARRFGVSRPTIREAMIVLEASGVVEVRNGSGTFALAPAERPRKLPVAAAPGPGPYEQFAARELIEGEVAARDATRLSAEAIGELEAI